jgi:hypothetical protein
MVKTSQANTPAKQAKQTKTPVAAAEPVKADTPVVAPVVVPVVAPVVAPVVPVKAAGTKTKRAKVVAPAAVAAPAVPAAESEPAQEETTASGRPVRYFKLTFEGADPRGRFSGTKPKQAASKALTSIINQRKASSTETVGEFNFSIVECTRGSKNKQYNYIGECVKLEQPTRVQIKGTNKEIVYNFNNKVRKDKSFVQVAGSTEAPVKRSSKKDSKKKRSSKKGKKAEAAPVVVDPVVAAPVVAAPVVAVPAKTKPAKKAKTSDPVQAAPVAVQAASVPAAPVQAAPAQTVVATKSSKSTESKSSDSKKSVKKIKAAAAT